jgi:hypothetical protein
MLLRFFFFLFSRASSCFIMTLLLSSLGAITLPQPALAQLEFTGYVGNYNAYTTRPPHELISARNRVRLNFRRTFRDGRAYVSTDLRQFYASSSDSLDFRLREAFIDVFLEHADLRIGKQAIAWGNAQGDFIFDLVSPFDLSEFLTQDFTELREGVTAVSYTRYIGSNQLQLLLNPAFEPSRLPDYDGRWGVVPNDIFPFPADFETYDPGTRSISDMQGAARFAWRGPLNFDLDVALLYWRSRTPGYRKEFETTPLGDFRIPEAITLTEDYKPSLIAGFWGEYRPGGDWQLPFELAYFSQRPVDILPGPLTDEDLQLLRRIQQEDGAADDLSFAELTGLLARFNEALELGEPSGFLSYQPALKWMAGVAHPVLGWDVSLQYLADITLQHDDDVLQEQWFHGLSAVLNQQFLRQRLLVRLLGRYQFNGQDFWLNPAFEYDFRDNLSLSLGAHLFGGLQPEQNYPQLSFRRYGSNSLGYASVKLFW